MKKGLTDKQGNKYDVVDVVYTGMEWILVPDDYVTPPKRYNCPEHGRTTWGNCCSKSYYSHKINIDKPIKKK